MSAPSSTAGRLVAFKRLAEPILGKMLQPEASATASVLVPYLKAGHVQWAGIDVPADPPLMWATPAEIAALSPMPGDLLICEGGEVGRAALVPTGLPVSTIIQNSLHLVRGSLTTSPRYLKYVLEHVAASGWLDLVCNKATIAHLTVDKLRELPVPHWRKPEQERIANFLDKQTTRIDALIADKEWMLATLASAREAHAFALTTSGTESGGNRVGRPEPWLSNVPKHWTVPKLGYIAEVGNGSTPRREVEKYWVDGTIPWITSTAIHDGIIDSTNEKITQEALADCHLRMVRPGSSIVGLIGQGPTRGMTAQLGISATLSQNVAFASARQSAQVDDEYLTICLTGLYSAMRYLSDGVGGAQGAMNCDQLRAIRVPLPPPVEQRAIAVEFRKREAALGGLLGHASEHIDRLREYRLSLISAAVNGQINIAASTVSMLDAA